MKAEYIVSMAPSYFVGFILLLIMCGIMAHSREILVNDENPVKKVNSIYIDDDEFLQDEIPCHMEYQVMKRVVGTCIRLGRSARGCVAGNYLHPLHPDCM